MYPGGKDGRCAGPTSLPPSCADYLEILVSKNSRSPTGLFSRIFKLVPTAVNIMTAFG
jgi:hypothetical protein